MSAEDITHEDDLLDYEDEDQTTKAADNKKEVKEWFFTIFRLLGLLTCGW